MLRLQFCTPKGNQIFLNKIFLTRLALVKNAIFGGKTDYKKKYQFFCSASHIFAHLQKLHAFLHVFSDTETTEAKTQSRPVMLTISCQTTQDRVSETAKKPHFTLLVYLSICCICLESTNFLLLQFLRVLVSVLWCPVEFLCGCGLVYTVTDVLFFGMPT